MSRLVALSALFAVALLQIGSSCGSGGGGSSTECSGAVSACSGDCDNDQNLTDTDVQTIRLAARNSLDNIVVTSGIVDVQITVPVTAPIYSIGRLHLYNGNYQEAGKMFSTYIQANPNGAFRNAALVHLADANTKNGEWEQATLNYYSALTGSPTWGTDVNTIDCFQNACKVVGTTTVNGLPMFAFTPQELGKTLQTSSFVEIDTDLQDRILIQNNSDPRFVETLRRVKGLYVNATDNALQLRGRTDLLEAFKRYKP